MGKNLIQQRRGRGSPRYRVPSHRYLGRVSYINMPGGEGRIKEIVHAPGRYGPVAVIDFSEKTHATTDGSAKRFMFLAADGVYVGQAVNAAPENGSAMRLRDIPEGSKIFNIELNPNDGGRLCRSSGAFATLIGKEGDSCTVLLPSRQKKVLSAGCMATIGSAASAGRRDKPFRKAGNKYYAMRAHGKLYPIVEGVSMNAVQHPFGGQTRPGKPKTVSRHMPPGKKVGSISPKRTGKRKR